MIRALWRHEWRMRRRDVTALAELLGFCASLAVVWTLLADRHMALPVPPIVATWISLVFAGVTYGGRSFDAEWHSDGSRVLESWQQLPHVLAPIFWIKWATTCVVLCGAGAAVYAVLHAVPLQAAPVVTWRSGVALGAGLAGLTALGTLFAGALCAEARRSALLPIICYPLAIPLLLVVSQGVLCDSAADPTATIWAKLAAGTGLLYVILASWLFAQLLERSPSP